MKNKKQIEESRIEYAKDKKIKYVVEFEDQGQDLEKVHINQHGIIIKTETWGLDVFTGKITIPECAKVGEKLAIWMDREAYIQYPIKNITVN